MKGDDVSGAGFPNAETGAFAVSARVDGNPNPASVGFPDAAGAPKVKEPVLGASALGSLAAGASSSFAFVVASGWMLKRNFDGSFGADVTFCLTLPFPKADGRFAGSCAAAGLGEGGTGISSSTSVMSMSPLVGVAVPFCRLAAGASSSSDGSSMMGSVGSGGACEEAKCGGGRERLLPCVTSQQLKRAIGST